MSGGSAIASSWRWSSSPGRRCEGGSTSARLLAAGTGLLAAHRAGLVHRDFKPDNVLVGEAAGELAEAELELARALWLSAERREEALALARKVRAVYVGEGERRRSDLERLDAWLAEVGAQDATP